MAGLDEAFRVVDGGNVFLAEELEELLVLAGSAAAVRPGRTVADTE